MSKIRTIEINFPVPVDFPEGWEETLDALIGMVCKQYQKENPKRVMWPGGFGAKPIWNEPDEPEYDTSVYCIDICEREDLHGNNPHNPDQEELREKARAARKAKRATITI